MIPLHEVFQQQFAELAIPGFVCIPLQIDSEQLDVVIQSTCGNTADTKSRMRSDAVQPFERVFSRFEKGDCFSTLRVVYEHGSAITGDADNILEERSGPRQQITVFVLTNLREERCLFDRCSKIAVTGQTRNAAPDNLGRWGRGAFVIPNQEPPTMRRVRNGSGKMSRNVGIFLCVLDAQSARCLAFMKPCQRLNPSQSGLCTTHPTVYSKLTVGRHSHHPSYLTDSASPVRSSKERSASLSAIGRSPTHLRF